MPGGVPLMDWGIFPERDEEQDDWKVADWAIEQIKAAAKEPDRKRTGRAEPVLPLGRLPPSARPLLRDAALVRPLSARSR